MQNIQKYISKQALRSLQPVQYAQFSSNNNQYLNKPPIKEEKFSQDKAQEKEMNKAVEGQSQWGASLQEKEKLQNQKISQIGVKPTCNLENEKLLKKQQSKSPEGANFSDNIRKSYFGTFNDKFQQKLSGFWQGKQKDIEQKMNHTKNLSQMAQEEKQKQFKEWGKKYQESSFDKKPEQSFSSQNNLNQAKSNQSSKVKEEFGRRYKELDNAEEHVKSQGINEFDKQQQKMKADIPKMKGEGVKRDIGNRNSHELSPHAKSQSPTGTDSSKRAFSTINSPNIQDINAKKPKEHLKGLGENAEKKPTQVKDPKAMEGEAKSKVLEGIFAKYNLNYESSLVQELNKWKNSK